MKELNKMNLKNLKNLNNINEELKYKISLKKGYKIFYIIMSILFFGCMMFFGIVSFFIDTDVRTISICITLIFFIFLLCSLYNLTKKCERCKRKIMYSYLWIKKKYRLSDIVSFNTKNNEIHIDQRDGIVNSSYDKITTFYDKQGKKLFKFGLAYDNIQLLVNDVKNTQKSISNKKRKK